ncbi:ABC transporter, putative [Bodo saltans]|uniref:ABC transporter, putative n=1 Tax=Bodo saltans TaxID=75058 RepID=A0A0S4JAB2_BODSA|nr:ABC transporter, putative [Bodo saltans]|eukprot:CUG88436.1 ABC transporter, putative [Bodo saltans]
MRAQEEPNEKSNPIDLSSPLLVVMRLAVRCMFTVRKKQQQTNKKVQQLHLWSTRFRIYCAHHVVFSLALSRKATASFAFHVMSCRLSVVACFAIALTVAFLPQHSDATASRNKDLYPRCATTEVSAQAIGGLHFRMQRLSQKTSELVIACIAADVSAIGGTVSDAACTIAHQTDYAYRLFINASFIDPVTNTVRAIQYELKDVMGGSANRIHIRLPAEGTYELMFANQAHSSFEFIVLITLFFLSRCRGRPQRLSRFT